MDEILLFLFTLKVEIFNLPIIVILIRYMNLLWRKVFKVIMANIKNNIFNHGLNICKLNHEIF